MELHKILKLGQFVHSTLLDPLKKSFIQMSDFYFKVFIIQHHSFELLSQESACMYRLFGIPQALVKVITLNTGHKTRLQDTRRGYRTQDEVTVCSTEITHQ